MACHVTSPMQAGGVAVGIALGVAVLLRRRRSGRPAPVLDAKVRRGSASVGRCGLALCTVNGVWFSRRPRTLC